MQSGLRRAVDREAKAAIQRRTVRAPGKHRLRSRCSASSTRARCGGERPSTGQGRTCAAVRAGSRGFEPGMKHRGAAWPGGLSNEQEMLPQGQTVQGLPQTQELAWRGTAAPVAAPRRGRGRPHVLRSCATARRNRRAGVPRMCRGCACRAGPAFSSMPASCLRSSSSPGAFRCRTPVRSRTGEAVTHCSCDASQVTAQRRSRL